MQFTAKQDSFPSTAQKSIWHASVFMAPFREFIPPGAAADERHDIVSGEQDWYAFISELYQKMYQAPGVYYVPVERYDQYMHGRTRSDLPHKNDSRECTLRNEFQNAIKFYQNFLYKIGEYGTIDAKTYRLGISRKQFESLIQTLNINKKENDVRKRIDALHTVGLTYSCSDDFVQFSCARYPRLFIGLSLLAKSENKKYAYTCYLTCNYREAVKTGSPKFEDALFVLTAAQQKLAKEVHTLMIEAGADLKVKPLRSTQLTFFWKLQYTRKGKALATLHIDVQKLDCFINFNSVTNISKVGYRLKKDSEELYGWFFDCFKLRECSCKNNRNADIGGRRKRICGLMNRMEIYDMRQSDLEKIKQILQVFYAII